MYLSIKKLSEYAGVHPNTLRSWLKIGMPHYRFGKRILVKVSEFDDWMKRFKIGGTTLKNIINEVIAEVHDEVQIKRR
ncbi:MAG: helix-turn-helix domain-containing protein [Candidatus Caldarchaeum sp.]